MRKQTKRCMCESATPQYELNDEFKSICCETCWEITSYEIPNKKVTRTKKQNIERGTLNDFINVLNLIRQ